MKKILALFTCILLIVATANAQKQDSSKYAKDKQRVKNMDSTHKQNLKDNGVTKQKMKDLNLSKDQEKQLDDIHSNTRQEKEKINNDNSLTPEQKQEKLKQVDKEEKSKMNNVLTPEQRQKAKQDRANAKKKKNS
jgi:Spy/CpxP family protein refolding chaperone